MFTGVERLDCALCNARSMFTLKEESQITDGRENGEGDCSDREYRVSSKTVPTWFFALLTASTHTNCKGWDIFAKFRKFAT